MNKRAALEDIVDIVWTVAVVIVALLVFGTFVNANQMVIEKAIKDSDLQLEQDTALMNYLRMPAEGGLTMADMFSLVQYDDSYLDKLTQVTRNDPYFSNQKIEADLSSVTGFARYPVSVRVCTGKTSIAYLPVKDKKPIQVILTLCT